MNDKIKQAMDDEQLRVMNVGDEKAGHTPGPWHIDWNGGMAPIVLGVHLPGRTRHIAHIQFHAGSNDSEVYGNARLIAGCPTLFEYVKMRAEKGDEDAQKIIANIV